jgi:hypothetical protein
MSNLHAIGNPKLVIARPVFTYPEDKYDEVKKLCQKFVDRVHACKDSEAAGCIHYDILFNTSAVRVAGRHVFESVDAFYSTMKAVEDLFPEIFDLGLEAVEFELSGPKEELEAIKDELPPWNVVFYTPPNE